VPRCPHCGEPLDVFVDEGGAEQQDYIEDCAVCCRPIRFFVRRDPVSGEHEIEVSSEI